MTATTPLHSLVSNVIGGSTLVQRARKRGFDTEVLEDPNSPDTLELYRELTATVGLNFELTASHVLTSITALLTDDEVSDYNVKNLSRTLWKILGDPEKNGDEPPELYTEAGKAMYAWVLVLLYPIYIKE